MINLHFFCRHSLSCQQLLSLTEVEVYFLAEIVIVLIFLVPLRDSTAVQVHPLLSVLRMILIRDSFIFIHRKIINNLKQHEGLLVDFRLNLFLQFSGRLRLIINSISWMQEFYLWFIFL